MSATDELRRLLDECDITIYDYGTEVWWGGESSGGGGAKYTAYEQTDGLICVEMADLTPEQAIAATLGRESDDAAMVRLYDQMNAALLEYERAQGIEKRDGDEAIVVPWVAKMHALLEEAAMLGTGTCHITDNGPWGYPYVCSACGASFDPDVNNGEFNYCPNCGRKIVGATTNNVDMGVDE